MPELKTDKNGVPYLLYTMEEKLQELKDDLEAFEEDGNEEMAAYCREDLTRYEAMLRQSRPPKRGS